MAQEVREFLSCIQGGIQRYSSKESICHHLRCVYLASSSHVLKDALQEKERNFYLELVHSEQVSK